MAAKKRSASKASPRPSSRKGKPSAKKHAQPQARKAKSPVRQSGKTTRPKVATVRPATKPKSKGSKPISTTKPAASAPRHASTKPASPRNGINVLAQRQAALRRPDSAPLTSSVGLIHGIPPYQPKPGEAYMSERQLEHFRNILLAWKRELMEEVDRTVHHMQDEASNFPDPNDRATQESEFGLELRTRDRERKLLKKIDAALARIEDGSYGYCEETGEEIGLKRLEARPVATLSVEAQERRELAERQFRDREDSF